MDVPYGFFKMDCRIGMATDVPARILELKGDRTVPPNATYRILQSGLTYEEANEYERVQREQCGPHCQGQTGGRRVSSNGWSIYRIDW